MVSDLRRLSLTLEQIDNIKVEAVRHGPYAKRVSLGFAVRLLQMKKETGEDIDVLREVDGLEGIAEKPSTKDATQFKRAPLHPLWHKHFSTTRHVISNFGIRWGTDKGGNRDLSEMIDEVAASYGDQPELWQKSLIHKFVIGGIEDRAAANRMTGDWIVFGKYEGQNYYLDVATHAEGDDPAQLMEKLRGGSEFEFPFLFKNNPHMATIVRRHR